MSLIGWSAGPEDPGSCNRYSFTKNDPVNHTDRTGRFIDPDSCLNLVCEVDLPVDCFDEFECEDQGGGLPTAPPVSPAPGTIGLAGVALYNIYKTNVKDSGIVQLLQTNYPGKDPCTALPDLLAKAKQAGDTEQIRKIERTQKGYGCRNKGKRR